MAMRLSGLMSGMDTESIIEQLVMAKRTKVDNAKKAQTKLQWTQDAWKTLNTKIKKFYDGALSNLRFESSFMKKVTKVSNSSVVSVITGANAMNSVQNLKVKNLAKPGYLTGGQVGDRDNKGKLNLTSDDRLTKLGYDFDDRGKINITVGDQRTEVILTGATTIGDLVQSFRDAGLNASFDAANQRFYIASKDTGEAGDFTITAGDINGLFMLEDLGLSYVDEKVTGYYDNIVAMDQEKEVESRLQGRLDSRLKELTNRQTGLNGQWDDLTAKLEELKTKIPALDGIDLSDPKTADLDQVRTAIETYMQEEDGSLSEDDKAQLNGLMDDLDSVQNELIDIDGRLTTDEEGNVVLSDAEKESVKEKIEAEVAHEVEDAQKMLDILNEAAEYSGAHKEDGEDAVIILNGVEYKGSSNTFEINGLTLTVNATTGENEVVTLTTQDDTDGIYDMIKGFIKEYNELINEMDKLYNADSSKGYDPLTDDEKDAMSDREIEEWESKIKDSLLRRDDTLGMVSSALKQMMLTGITVNGKPMYLSNFGIETLGYFTAADNEKNAYHIDGDTDDANTSGNADKLKAMIASDPQAVVDFFVGLSRSMYSELTERMSKTDYSSSYTIYEDVRMKQEYDSYTQKIKDLEAKLADYEDKWYSKFAKMETALSKLQSNVSAVTALLGG